MSLLQAEITKGEVQKDVNMLCGIFPEGIADKAFPAGSPACRQYFFATVRVIPCCREMPAMRGISP